MRVAYTIYSLRRTYAYLRLTRTTITATIALLPTNNCFLPVELFTFWPQVMLQTDNTVS